MRLLYLGLIIMLNSCFGKSVEESSEEVSSYEVSAKKYSIVHYNIIIAPDLSNRLTIHNKPVSDNEIIDSILTIIYPTVANYKRKMNQVDKYRLDIINPRQISQYSIKVKDLYIDLSRFTTQNDRIKYLAPFETRSQFNLDKKRFIDEFARITAQLNKNTAGSDIWTYLNEELDDFKVDTTTKITTYENDEYLNQYKNILILLTDGYLESSNNFPTGNMNKCLTQAMINKFRDDYNAKGKGRSMNDFFKEKGYGITKLNNPMLKYTDILVLELYDRSLGKSGATKSPTDMEIIKLFWSHWFTNSGVKKFDFVPISQSASSTKQRIIRFIGVE